MSKYAFSIVSTFVPSSNKRRINSRHRTIEAARLAMKRLGTYHAIVTGDCGSGGFIWGDVPLFSIDGTRR